MAGGGEEIDAQTLRVLQSDQGQAGGPLSHPLPEVKIINRDSKLPIQNNLSIIEHRSNMVPQGLHGTLPTSRDTPTLLVQHLVPLGFKIPCSHDGLQDPLEDCSVGQLPCAATRASGG